MKRSALLLTMLLWWAIAASSDSLNRPHIFGIRQVEFYSTNVEAAGSFFTAIFGSQNAPSDTCAWGNVSQVTGHFSFHGSCAEQNLRLLKPPKPLPSTFLYEVAFATNDMKALKTYLQSKKVAIAQTGDVYLSVLDPEGHRIGFFQSSGPEAKSSPNNLRLIHAGFIVHHRVATEHFYKDILGFRPYWHGGMKDNQTDWVSMQVPDGTDWLEFMVNVGPDADQRLRGIMNHIAIGVTDIHATQQKLIDNRVKLTEEPKIGRDGKWQLNLYDPDLTRIEFMEFTPVQKPCCSEFTGPHPKP